MARLLSLNEYEELAASGAYGGARELSPLTCAFLLSLLSLWPSQSWAWVDWYDSEDGIEALVAQAIKEVQTDMASLPLGIVVPFAGADVPPGWHEMDGTFLLASEYPDLWAVIDDGFKGTSGGQDAIALRDMTFKTAIGYGSEYYPMGGFGGEVEHTLSVLEMPEHKHSIYSSWLTGGSGNAHVVTANGGYPGYRYTGDTGGGQPHNNMPPYMCFRWMMKVSNA